MTFWEFVCCAVLRRSCSERRNGHDDHEPAGAIAWLKGQEDTARREAMRQFEAYRRESSGFPWGDAYGDRERAK